MAILAVDEMLREPRLLVPGLQPLGLVKVDWNNAITKGLSFCALGRSGKSAYPIDLVGKSERTSGSGTLTYTRTAKGIARYSSSGSDWYTGNADIDAATEGTFVWIGTLATGINAYVAHTSNLGTAGGWGLQNYGGLKLYLGGGEISVSVTPITDAWHIVCCSFKAGAQHIRGGYSWDGTSADSPITGTGYLKINSARDYSANGQWEFFALWKKYYPPSVLSSLATDPYQFLIPA